jgi:predicted hotdog family 3-hydroxylacyl-ACP dehydratase
MASSQEIIAAGKAVEEFLPQRPPMVMIGALHTVSDSRIVTSLRITPENIFVQDGRFREAGLIENIAQTAAAGTGYRYRSRNEIPPPGFIGGIKNLVIHDLPTAGDEIITEVSVLHEILNATVVEGKIYCNDILIAACELRIFLLPT